jgi:ribosomal protein S18 acetylase RimI-like enzyme
MAPQGFTIRTATDADLEAVARIHVASWQDAYKGIIPDTLIANHTVQGSLLGWRSTVAKYPENVTVAAMTNAAIAGFCCAGPVVHTAKNAPFEFEIYALHVEPGLRRNGIGAALLRAALARAKSEGMRSAIVWTLEGLTLSRRFYEREGGHLVKTGVWSLGGYELPDLAYGWTGL